MICMRVRMSIFVDLVHKFSSVNDNGKGMHAKRCLAAHAFESAATLHSRLQPFIFFRWTKIYWILQVSI